MIDWVNELKNHIDRVVEDVKHIVRVMKNYWAVVIIGIIVCVVLWWLAISTLNQQP